jgi:hypothetical protein
LLIYSQKLYYYEQMSELGDKGLSQLLLSPLFLFRDILGTIIPGTLLMLLFGLKGNALLRGMWLDPLFGYKTKVVIFLMLAFVLGNILKLPIVLIASLVKKEEVVPWLKGQSPEVQKMIGAVITDGVILSTPGLVDRLSLFQADGAFHIGTGIALMVAAFVPGDGSLRWIEGVLGVGMFVAGILKGRQYADEVLRVIGIGTANVLARMNPQQIDILKATIKAFSVEPAKQITEVTVTTNPKVESTQSNKT